MRILLVMILLAGCSTPQMYRPSYPPLNPVEAAPLPPDPTDAEPPAELEKGDWIEAIERGQCADISGRVPEGATKPCPLKSGILSSEARAWRDGQFRLRYKELRLNYEADRKVWSAHREFYDAQSKADLKALQDAQPNWWDRNKFTLGVTGGIILGVAASVAILAATDGNGN
jgi:hypothetical protein